MDVLVKTAIAFFTEQKLYIEIFARVLKEIVELRVDLLTNIISKKSKEFMV